MTRPDAGRTDPSAANATGAAVDRRGAAPSPGLVDLGMPETARALLRAVVPPQRADAPATAVAVVGLAKNCGKTTAARALVTAARSERMALGLVSAGRDGEPRDELLGHPKPPVEVETGDLVVTSWRAITKSGVAWRPLGDIGRTAADGGTVVCAAIEAPGSLELDGCNTVAALSRAVDKMRSHGADLIVVDGSADRLSASACAVADRVVLATGLAVSEDARGVAESTRWALRRLCGPPAAISLPPAAATLCASLLDRRVVGLVAWSDAPAPHAVAGGQEHTSDAARVLWAPEAGSGSILGREREVCSSLLNLKTFLDVAAESPATYLGLVVPGAVTPALLRELDRMVGSLSGRFLARLVVVVAEPWMAVASPYQPQPMELRSQVVAVRAPTVSAVTTNPWTPWNGPSGGRVDARELLLRVARVVWPVPVFDVVAGVAATAAGAGPAMDCGS